MNKDKIYSNLGIIFLFLSSYSAYLLRGSTNNDLNLFLFVILICVTTDIGGYVFGKIFKGPKLTQISPNKTYAGSIGGYFVSLIIATFYLNEYNFTSLTLSWYLNDLNTLILIFLISSVSQAGDLTISYFKRLSKIKNTGKILPGHGGLLDRADGILFAVPFAYILFKFI